MNPNIRELCQYDIRFDTAASAAYLMRHCVLVSKEPRQPTNYLMDNGLLLTAFRNARQFHVDHVVHENDLQAVCEARIEAEKLLTEAIEKEGYAWEDAFPLPIPPGYKPPEWLETPRKRA